MVAKENFFKAHWDWLVAACGLVALGGVGALVAPTLGTSAEDAESACMAWMSATKPAHEGVAPVSLDPLKDVLKAAKKPALLTDLDDKKASFLVSGRRLFCKAGNPEDKAKACGRPIPDGLAKCPFCGTEQLFEKVEVDADGDTLPNEWEVKYGLNPNDPSDAAKDADGDGFTNLEEFQAKTDPKDAKSHPDYLDSLSVASELRQTFLPFWLNVANPIPGGYRLVFVRNSEEIKSKYEDKKFSVKVGEAVKSADGKINTGYIVKKFTPLTEQRAVKGAKGAKRMEDVSTVELVRKADGKTITARINERKVPVETQIDLVYRRGEEKSFTVSVGTEITLNGRKYRIVALKPKGKACEVTVEDLQTKKQKIIRNS